MIGFVENINTWWLIFLSLFELESNPCELSSWTIQSHQTNWTKTKNYKVALNSANSISMTFFLVFLSRLPKFPILWRQYLMTCLQWHSKLILAIGALQKNLAIIVTEAIKVAKETQQRAAMQASRKVRERSSIKKNQNVIQHTLHFKSWSYFW